MIKVGLVFVMDMIFYNRLGWNEGKLNIFYIIRLNKFSLKYLENILIIWEVNCLV